MGFLKDGVWVKENLSSYVIDGTWVRPPTQFREKITRDGSSGFPAVAGRYHLYVSFACPWASRTLIVRKLKHLENVISLSIVHPFMGAEGWEFGEFPGSIPDFVNDKQLLRDVYLEHNPGYSGRVTVPVLWDKEKRCIVNNESKEICLMMNSEFDTPGTPDLYPRYLRPQINELNEEMYHALNNGVYKTGYTTIQEQYDQLIEDMFGLLDRLDQRLGHSRFLVGNTFTMADVHLFVSLVRFDPVYYVLFKCCKRTISSYHNLLNYLRDIYQRPEIQDTVQMDHIRIHYYQSMWRINPFRIMATCPLLSYGETHDRDRFPDETGAKASQESPEYLDAVQMIGELGIIL